MFTNNLGYAANPILRREALERAASYFVPFLVVTAPLWWAGWRAVRADTDPYRRMLAAALIVWALPAALVGFRFYPHYFIQLYVPLAIASAPVVSRWLARPLGRRGLWFVAWSLTMVIGFAISTVVLYCGHTRVYREINPVFERVSQRLAADPCHAGATLFVWGYAPVFYYHARLPAASRFVVLAQARLTDYVSGNLASVRGGQPVSGVVEPRHWDWLMDDLERRRATYILDTAPAGSSAGTGTRCGTTPASSRTWTSTSICSTRSIGCGSTGGAGAPEAGRGRGAPACRPSPARAPPEPFDNVESRM